MPSVKFLFEITDTNGFPIFTEPFDKKEDAISRAEECDYTDIFDDDIVLKPWMSSHCYYARVFAVNEFSMEIIYDEPIYVPDGCDYEN